MYRHYINLFIAFHTTCGPKFKCIFNQSHHLTFPNCVWHCMHPMFYFLSSVIFCCKFQFPVLFACSHILSECTPLLLQLALSPDISFNPSCSSGSMSTKALASLRVSYIVYELSFGTYVSTSSCYYQTLLTFFCISAIISFLTMEY